MKRIRITVLCLVAILALGALVAASASAQIAFQGKSFVGYGERVGSCNVPKPTGVVPGDQMLMQVYAEDPEARGPFTLASSGWQLVEKIENKTSGIWFAFAVFTKKYEAGDPAEYPVTWTGTAKRGCGALAAAWSGVSSSEPINAHLGAASMGPSTIVRAPSITTTKPNSMVVMLGDYNAPDTRTAPPGMEDIAGPEGVIAQVLQPEAGATGDKDAKTGKAEANVGVLVALTPEPTAPPAPTVTNVNPNAGPEAGGTSVTITGTNFTAATAVKFGSTNATSFTVNSATSITATAPAGTGIVDTTVKTAGGTSSTSAADQFSYVPLPTVTNVNPNAGPEAGGTSVTITGTNFTGATEVKFGSASATSFTVNSPTSITATAPAGNGTVDSTVTTAGGTSSTSAADRFSYDPLPEVLSVSPNSGPEAGGTSVTITGTSFSGATEVKFGSASATSFTVNSPTSITATAPAGGGTVDTTVTTPGGISATSAADQFSYAPRPTVTAIKRHKGHAAGGTTVTITGTSFTGVTEVQFGSVSAASYVVESPTTIKAVSPAEMAGTVDVTVTTPNGTSVLSSADHYTFGPPTITGVIPSSGPEPGGIVTIAGTGFGPGTNVTTVKFGKTVATSVNCESIATCTVVAPSHVAGTVDVRASVSGMKSPKTAADQFTYE